ncbi:hypothetical protein [Ktedonobacter sp. SOSP1-85]|uniref:hypothetical protein n=1 Tax=Ktedonobacter sp. SOSP1-85 TaxID=2778367 RepID=UPI001914DAED|nr:hypothetical protein [Ktedonobacter sp. SOSP1-85]
MSLVRCHPIIVEQIRSQGNDGGGIGSTPTHASFFHAIDDDGHGSLDYAATGNLGQE